MYKNRKEIILIFLHNQNIFRDISCMINKVKYMRCTKILNSLKLVTIEGVINLFANMRIKKAPKKRKS